MEIDSLFREHLADIQENYSHLGEVFVCPVCLGIFFYEDLDSYVKNKQLSTGHVWPEYFRQLSHKAKRQIVLLCTTCNSNTGHRGDNMMQVVEEIRQGEKSGKLRGGKSNRKGQLTKEERWIRFGNREKFAYTQVYVEKLDNAKVNLSLPSYQNENQNSYFLRQFQKLEPYLSEPNSFLQIYPPEGKPGNPFGSTDYWPLAQVGWLTSAYLFAFYEFGYDYIFSPYLDPVRYYIQKSLSEEPDKTTLNFDRSKNMCVGVYSEPANSPPNPIVGFVIPTNKEIPIHTEVRFLDYYIRLPFPGGDTDRRRLITYLSGDESLYDENAEDYFMELTISKLDRK